MKKHNRAAIKASTRKLVADAATEKSALKNDKLGGDNSHHASRYNLSDLKKFSKLPPPLSPSPPIAQAVNIMRGESNELPVPIDPRFN